MIALLAGCVHAHEPPVVTPAPGVAIALYDAHDRGIAVIDDRRWIDITGDRIVLEDLDAGVPLSSLVVEPLSGPGHIAFGTCVRDRVEVADEPESPSGLGDNPVPPPPQMIGRPRSSPASQVVISSDLTPAALAPTIHCAVTGPPGHYLVRLLYSSTTLAFHAEHHIALVDAEHAHVSGQLSVTTPTWRSRGGAPTMALVTAYDGLPGGDTMPVELARGLIAIDGSVGVLALPGRDVPARLRRVLAPSQDIAAQDEPSSVWIQQHRSGNADEPDALVWVWLEIPALHLSPGIVQVVVAAIPGEDDHEVVVAAEDREPDEDSAGVLRLPLWADDTLRADIQRAFVVPNGDELYEKFTATVLDIGAAQRSVFVEEKLRPDAKRSVTHATPVKPGLVGNTLRVKLVVDPAKVERVSFVVKYAF